jgi:hypothetical protein
MQTGLSRARGEPGNLLIQGRVDLPLKSVRNVSDCRRPEASLCTTWVHGMSEGGS